jgi:hypothetical protein
MSLQNDTFVSIYFSVTEYSKLPILKSLNIFDNKLERYNSVLQDAIDAGQPVPVGLHIIARPEMVFVPVRFTVDFNKTKLNISLWVKKLAG